jgi:CRP/FNR family transcriptional regulator, cyclic AMP receptor protein
MQNITALKPPKAQPVDWEALLNGNFRGKTAIECDVNRNIFLQGQPADSIFWLQQGKVKLTVISPKGKEAIIAILGSGEFFGEGCVAGRPLRMATAASRASRIFKIVCHASADRQNPV